MQFTRYRSFPRFVSCLSDGLFIPSPDSVRRPAGRVNSVREINIDRSRASRSGLQPVRPLYDARLKQIEVTAEMREADGHLIDEYYGVVNAACLAAQVYIPMVDKGALIRRLPRTSSKPGMSGTRAEFRVANSPAQRTPDP